VKTIVDSLIVADKAIQTPAIVYAEALMRLKRTIEYASIDRARVKKHKLGYLTGKIVRTHAAKRSRPDHGLTDQQAQSHSRPGLSRRARHCTH
jgi:hypothetical protein